MLAQNAAPYAADADKGDAEQKQLSGGLEAIMARHARLDALVAQDERLQQVLSEVQAWQRHRISRTYRRLLVHEAFGDATRFVLEEAYAGPEHDALISEIERVIPHVVRIFPAPLVKTACDILELNTLTLALDIDVARWLLAHAPEVLERGLSVVDFEAAYCAQPDLRARQEQLALMERLGKSVEHYLGSQWVYAAFKVAKLPAKALGLSSLVRFMQGGFEAIHKLPVPASELMTLLVDTERSYLERLTRGERGVFTAECQLAESGSKAILARLGGKARTGNPIAV